MAGLQRVVLCLGVGLLLVHQVAEASTCSMGEFLNGTSCLNCTVGTYQDGVSHTMTSCKDCTGNQTTESAGATSASMCACPAGTELSGSNCTSCDQNKYNSQFNSTCQSCPNAGFTTSAGSDNLTSCIVCAAGLQPDGVGACTSCSAEFFKAAAGNTNCSACAAGSDTRGLTGQTSCQEKLEEKWWVFVIMAGAAVIVIGLISLLFIYKLCPQYLEQRWTLNQKTMTFQD